MKYCIAIVAALLMSGAAGAQSIHNSGGGADTAKAEPVLTAIPEDDWRAESLRERCGGTPCNRRTNEWIWTDAGMQIMQIHKQPTGWPAPSLPEPPEKVVTTVPIDVRNGKFEEGLPGSGHSETWTWDAAPPKRKARQAR